MIEIAPPYPAPRYSTPEAALEAMNDCFMRFSEDLVPVYWVALEGHQERMQEWELGVANG